jgi:hypothetical protein
MEAPYQLASNLDHNAKYGSQAGRYESGAVKIDKEERHGTEIQRQCAYFQTRH